MKKLILVIITLIGSSAIANPICKVNGEILRFQAVGSSGIPTFHEIAEIDDELLISSRVYTAYGIGHLVSLYPLHLMV